MTDRAQAAGIEKPHQGRRLYLRRSQKYIPGLLCLFLGGVAVGVPQARVRFLWSMFSSGFPSIRGQKRD